jgi:hypothetical protein
MENIAFDAEKAAAHDFARGWLLQLSDHETKKWLRAIFRPFAEHLKKEKLSRICLVVLLARHIPLKDFMSTIPVHIQSALRSGKPSERELHNFHAHAMAEFVDDSTVPITTHLMTIEEQNDVAFCFAKVWMRSFIDPMLYRTITGGMTESKYFSENTPEVILAVVSARVATLISLPTCKRPFAPFFNACREGNIIDDKQILPLLRGIVTSMVIDDLRPPTAPQYR